MVQGYTDSDGTFEENKVLSLKRAEYVEKYFVNIGIAADSLLIKGIDEPVEEEASEEERRKNRRVTFKAMVDGNEKFRI